MMRRWRVTLLAACVFAAANLLSVAAGDAPPPEPKVEREADGRVKGYAVSNEQPWRKIPESWRKMLDFYVDAQTTPGILVMIKNPEWGVRVGWVGKPQIDAEWPFHPAAQFRVGSCSKMFTSIVALQLEAEGKLRLDAPITTWLDQAVVPNAEDITVEMCLNMTSGVYSYTEVPLLGDPNEKTALNVYTPEDLLKWTRTGDPYFEPGTETANPIDTLANGMKDWESRKLPYWAYTNTGYTIVGLIIEKITGHPIQEEIQRRIFDKVGMKNSVFALDEKTPPNMLHGYTGMKEYKFWIDTTVFNPSVAWTAGAIISSCWDLLHFYEKLFKTRELLSPLSYAKLFHMINANFVMEDEDYGLGMLQMNTPWGVCRGHGGTIIGYLTLAVYYPDHDTYMIMCINTWDNKYQRAEIGDRLARLIHGAVAESVPGRDAKGVKRDAPGGGATLAWREGLLYSDRFDVYVGTDPDKVEAATPENHPDVEYAAATARTFATKALAPATKYYWRVDGFRVKKDKEVEKEEDEVETLLENEVTYKYREVPRQETIQGPLWSFTTE